MLLSQYIKGLQTFLKLYGDMPCYYAKDAEGNGYEEVSYDGTLFYVPELEHRLDSVYGSEEEYVEDYGDEEELICICVVN